MKDYEIGIVDVAGVLRKHWRLIAAATAVCALAAAVFIFSRPRIREVEALFYPARLSTLDDKGQATSVMVLPFQTLAGQLQARELVPYIAKKSDLPAEGIPQIYVETVPGTNQVRFYIQDRDIAVAERVLAAYLEIIEADMNAMLERRLAEAESELSDPETNVDELDTRIREAEREIEFWNRELSAAESLRASSIDEEKALSLEIRELKKKIAGLEERHKLLSGRNDPESAREARTVSDLILAGTRRINSHYESIKSERALRGDLGRRIGEIAEKRSHVLSRAASLRSERYAITMRRDVHSKVEKSAVRAHVLQAPSALSRPVNPPKAVPIVLAGALGFLLTFFPAVFIEIGKRAAQG